MSRNALTAASVAALALAGTVVGTAGPAQSSHRSYPSGCAPRDVAGLVLRFLDAHNAGATDEADRFFAPATNDDLVEDARDGELGFQWYSVSGSVGQRINAEARNRATLATYFSERHAQGERLDLIAISLNYRTWLSHGVGFVFLPRRAASDLPRPGRERPALLSARAASTASVKRSMSGAQAATSRRLSRADRRGGSCHAVRRVAGNQVCATRSCASASGPSHQEPRELVDGRHRALMARAWFAPRFQL